MLGYDYDCEAATWVVVVALNHIILSHVSLSAENTSILPDGIWDLRITLP